MKMVMKNRVSLYMQTQIIETTMESFETEEEEDVHMEEEGRGRSYQEFDIPRITFFRCDNKGHFASSCPDRLLKLQETYENRIKEITDDTQEADRLLMHEVVYLNEKKRKPQGV